MLPTIPSGNVASAIGGGYDVDNSCRFDGSNDYLTKTFSGSPTSNKIGTVSYWTKRSGLGASMFSGLVAVDTGVSSYGTNFTSGDNMDFWFYYDNSASAYDGRFTTNAKFRDVSAWFHVVFAWDTTQATNTNRLKLYINGRNQKDVSGYSAETYPDQDQTVTWGGTSAAHRIGANPENGNNKWNGYMAEVAYVDGVAHAVTDFGEFDEDSPTIWKPKDISSGITWGTNGFYLDFKNSADLGNDVSGNNNDFTATGIAAINQASDSPTNNFATWNSLIKTTASLVEGNLHYTTPGSNPVFGSLSTIGVTAGKWYGELKYTSGTGHKLVLGVADDNFHNGLTTASYDIGKSGTANSIAYVINTGDYRINNSNTSWGSAGGDGNIINMAIDRDNEKIYFGVDNTWGNSSDPAGNSGGIPTTALDSTADWFFGITSDTSGTGDVGEINFGNPSYANTSDAADANGYGAFEFAPPSGYLALCTKNLGSDGG